MMRRILAITCTLLIVVLCGCNKNNYLDESSGSKEPSYVEKEITITEDNFEDYFVLNCYMENFRQNKTRDLILNGFYNFDTYCDFVVSISPKSNINVKNVTVQIWVATTMNVSGSNLSTDNYLTYLTVTLPKSGEYKTTLNCSHSISLPMSSAPAGIPTTPDGILNSVEGTIIETVEV